MSGIIFLKSNLDISIPFYKKIGMDVWLDQGGCMIMKHGNMLLGFCMGEPEICGVITFFYETMNEVDSMYAELSDISDGKPRINEQYKIYHFYAKDPEGRIIEFQHFLK